MAVNFPAKVYQILENESPEIIRWHSNGCAFRIMDHDRFEREIIPKYFRHNQLSSVQRQLNLYGFKCVNRGDDKGAFFHPLFKRGDWEVVKKMTRFVTTKKGGADNAPVSAPSAAPSPPPPAAAPSGSLLVPLGPHAHAMHDEAALALHSAHALHPFNNNTLHSLAPPSHTAHTALPHNMAVPHFRTPFDPFAFFDAHALSAMHGVPASVAAAAVNGAPPHPPLFSVAAVPATVSPEDSPHSPFAAPCAAAETVLAEPPTVRAYPRNDSKKDAIARVREEHAKVLRQEDKEDAPAAAAVKLPSAKRAAHHENKLIQPFVFVVNDAVTIDPDFDLDDDFALFGDALDDEHHRGFAHSHGLSAREKAREIGTSTDFSVCPLCKK